MIAAVLFDLDDTLYDEGDYVRSGFRAVGRELEARGAGEGRALAAVFEELHFGEGRERVFDKAAARIGFPGQWVGELVKVYRAHEPEGLSLFEEAVGLLTRLRPSYQLGIVTDGWLAVQAAKVRALGVGERVDHVFLSDSLGRERWKPHPEPFLRCLAAMGGVAAGEAVFVGDNPERDVAGAQAAGLIPVHLRRPGAYFEDAPVEPGARATIRSLRELPALLEEWS